MLEVDETIKLCTLYIDNQILVTRSSIYVIHHVPYDSKILSDYYCNLICPKYQLRWFDVRLLPRKV